MIMHPNRTLLFIATAFALSLVTVSNTLATPVMASSKGGGAVAQEQVNSGNPNFDKQINIFYNCISKTHQDPPTIEKVDNCYYQTIGGGTNNGGTAGANGINSGGSSSTSTAGSTKHHHKE